MKFEKSCLIPTIIACVCGALLLGALIAVIVLAVYSPDSSSSSSEASVVFSEYSALVLPITLRPSHKVYGLWTRMNVFGPNRFVSESYDEYGTLSARAFSTKYGSRTVCNQFGNHGNCYTETYAGSMSFSLDRMQLSLAEYPCELLIEMFMEGESGLFSNRSLTNCDLYVVSDYINIISDCIVESGSKYPVLRVVKNYDDQQTSLTAYVSFKPKKPRDESGLEPFPGVTVYDFRDHEGDCDDSTTFTKRTDGAFDGYMNSILREKRIRDMLHIPAIHSLPIDPSRIRRSVPRDPLCIPTEFDARDYWGRCADTIGTITNQGICGSCWAMSSSGVLADRMCISYDVETQLSPQYMIYCGQRTYGCGGGNSVNTWVELVDEGTVPESCVPFAGADGQCPEKCWDGRWITDRMLVRAESIVFPWGKTAVSRVREIQTEILLNGPVQASFLTFSDFSSYEHGVYHRSKEATHSGSHAVRIIGWGTTDDGEDYWLVANSWGLEWGENGLFRIRRGTNECNIEEQVIAGIV